MERVGLRSCNMELGAPLYWRRTPTGCNGSEHGSRAILEHALPTIARAPVRPGRRTRRRGRSRRRSPGAPGRAIRRGISDHRRHLAALTQEEQRALGTPLPEAGNCLMSIHHVTAIAGDPQRNLDFYAGVLGLRLVKLTVNFDDPGQLPSVLRRRDGPAGLDPHLLSLARRAARPAGHADRSAPSRWPSRPRRSASGSSGCCSTGSSTMARPAGSTSRCSPSPIPTGSCSSWSPRRASTDVAPWADGPVPAEHAVRGLHGATIWEDGDRGTAEFLTPPDGIPPGRRGGQPPAVRVRRRRRRHAWWICAACRASGPVPVGWEPCTTSPSAPPSGEAQLERRARLESAGVDDHAGRLTASTSARSTSASQAACCSRSRPIRRASRSTSRRRSWGRSLKLPPMYEPMRDRIERTLPSLRLPQVRHAEVGEAS